MRLVEQEIARVPQDMDVRAWRARVLAWSGKLPEAEKQYREILRASRTDPDNWLGLAGVYLREGKIPEAQQAINAAEELDPKRPLNGTTVVYLPRDWTFTLAATGAHSAFSGTGVEWRPSGLSRLGFPLAQCCGRRLSGNVFFAAGTENFAIVDQIGSFASQTYGGGFCFQVTDKQDITGNAGYQRRTQNRTDLSFGLSYGIHF